jgi:protein SCO1/2
MIFLSLIFAMTLLFGNCANASVSFTPDWEKISGKALPDVRFTDPNGNIVRLSDYKDKILILHPMFTHCPSTCAFISSRLLTAINGLSTRERNNLLVVSFSFDPKETSESLTKFEKMFQIDRSYWKIVRAQAGTVQQLLAALDYRTLQLSTSNYKHPNIIFVVGKNNILRDYIYGGDLTSERLVASFYSSQAADRGLPPIRSYIYIFATAGLLISTFVAVAHFAKNHRH